jgi:CRISPR-associated protein Cmr4
MFKIARPLFLICETPLHAGSGDALGVVDLPIQRERHTGFPKIEASSLKGAIREAFEGNDKKIKVNEQEIIVNEPDATNPKEHKHIKLTFGPDDPGNEGHAGALGFTDARLLLFPVKSMKGVFAWITCPRVLRQFEKDMKLTSGFENFKIEGILDNPIEGEAYIIQENKTITIEGSNKEKDIVLEEYTFKAKMRKDIKIETENIGDWFSTHLFPKDNNDLSYWKNKIKTDIVILSDDDFTDFVNLSTEVITRTAIDNVTGTVKPGALFTEEFLPSESILYSLVLASPIFQPKEKKDKSIFYKDMDDANEHTRIIDFFEKGLKSVIQVGGNATLGKGIVRTKILNGEVVK